MKTAVFIGTFDPLHGGHIGQLLRADHFMALSKIYILVDKHPSHKPHASSWQHRLKMAQLTLGSFELPFNYDIIPAESSLATEFIQNVGYKITGIDSLIENLHDPKRWVFAQRWPMVVLSIPGVKESALKDAVTALPKHVRQTVTYQYVSEAAAPMMNYDFEQRAFISGTSSFYLPAYRTEPNVNSLTVRNYIQEHHLYQKKPEFDVLPR